MVKLDWYEEVSGDDLEQGDIIASCPIPISTSASLADIRHAIEQGTPIPSVVQWTSADLIIVSQSCDLEKSEGRLPKIERILLCPVFGLSAYEKGSPLASSDAQEMIRRGVIPSHHMVNSCEIENLEREVSTVNFQEIHTLPFLFVEEVAREQGPRLRLLSPYKEHLSQAFARFFMRVGLPYDVPRLSKLNNKASVKALEAIDGVTEVSSRRIGV